MDFVGVLKRIWILSWAGFLTITMFLPITISALLSSAGDLAFRLSQLWSWLMLKAMRVRIRTQNKEAIKPEQAYIIVANHQSSLDIVAIATSLGLKFRWVIKKELFWIPLFGWALYISKNIFIDRSNTEKAVQSINKGFKRIPPATSLIFFVEGTRSNDGNLGKFRKGAFVTAIKNNIPLLPVTINGAARLMPKGTILFDSGVIELIVGDPIETRSYGEQDADKLIEETKEVITSNLNPNYPLEIKSESGV